MIFIFFTGLGPGGLKTGSGFILGLACVPGSSHGGIGLPPGNNQLYSGPAYDQQDTVSLFGGSGGEKNFGHSTITVPYGILTTTIQAYIRRINCVLSTFY